MKQVLQEAKKNKIRLFKYLRDNNKYKEEQNIYSVLNFLEKMAFFAIEGDLDKDKLETYYRDIFEDFYKDFHGFMIDRREEKNHKKLYEYFEKLHQTWQVNGR